MSELLGISSISGILRFGRYPAYHGISEPHLAVKSSKTVDANGKVTAVAEGTATITVTTKDGSKIAECKVTVTEDAPQPTDKFAITATAGAGGTISPSGNVSVEKGKSQTFNFIPNYGYLVSEVVVDGVNKGISTSYTFTNVTAAHTIIVKFAKNPNAVIPDGSIGAKLPYIITDSRLSDGQQGTAYGAVFEADGFSEMYWEVIEGSLPVGLTLSADGRLTGIPEESGEFSFRVKVTNQFGYDTEAFSLLVADNGEEIEVEEPIEEKPDTDEEVMVEDETSEEPAEENPQTGAVISLLPAIGAAAVAVFKRK